MTPSNPQVTFIQYDIPPLKAGEYTVAVTQTVNIEGARPADQVTPNTFYASTRFAVAGERFSFQPGEIVSVFPPNLASGEFAGVLPHVVFARRTLPWERESVPDVRSAPWLAVLLFEEDEAPSTQKLTVADLVPEGQPIAVAGSTATGVGKLPANYLCYPGYTLLDYGELPTDPCTVIDVPVAKFSQIAPCVADLPLLGHIREVDTTHSEDNARSALQYAVLLGNRIAKDNTSACCFLVSLEHLGPYLPAADGTPSTQLPPHVEHVRLVTSRSWQFFATTRGETFRTLLENLNATAIGRSPTSSLQLSFEAPPPSSSEVESALDAERAGTMTDTGADVLVRNALRMGYVPLDHQLRELGRTVSWYRGPLTPFPIAATRSFPASCPDALNAYDPDTGMFDVSYGASWQLGQLLALQNRAFSVALYNWKKAFRSGEAAAEEQALIQAQLQGASILESFVGTRAARLSQARQALSAIPNEIATWIGRLRLLYGVPFQYLVTDERMLPPESLRFFYYDSNWIDALVDGAFSIGRFSRDDLTRDAEHLVALRSPADVAVRSTRPNPRLHAAASNDGNRITGFLLRSLAVSGWPRLNVNGYADRQGTSELALLRMSRLTDNVLLCIFDGVVEMVAIHEPPEQLHCGVEAANGTYTTTLRAVNASTPGYQPGQQLLSDSEPGRFSVATIPARGDGQTLMIERAARAIEDELNGHFGQAVADFTSAEFALEMIKGVVKVEFQTSADSAIVRQAR